MLELNVLNSDELKQRAHTLALENTTVYRKRGSTPFRKLRKIVKKLEAYSQEFEIDESAGFPLLPATEWLMDHVDLFKEQNLSILQNLPSSYYRSLPKWDTVSSQTRISVILKKFLQNMGGQASLPMLTQYIRAFQDITTLTIGELWSIPLFLKISLLEELGDLFEEIYERHKARKQAEELFQKWVPYLNDPGKLNFEIDQTTSNLGVLPTVLVVYIIGRLRDYGGEGIPIRQWIERKIGLQTEGIEKLMGHEHQLQANYRVVAGNLISSLRNVSRWKWEEQFESLSTVERILENDPSHIYLLMDFSSRDQLRHAVENIAQSLKVQECSIAQTAVALANRFSTTLPSEKVPQKHVGYYLVDQGKDELYLALQARRKVWQHPILGLKKHPTFTFLSSVMILAMLTLAVFWKSVGGFCEQTLWLGLALSVVLLVPASEWSLSIVNLLIQRCFPPKQLLRLEFKEGITPEAATMVVIPTFLSSETDVRKLFNQIEVHHLANQDPHIHFAILGDFRDASEETLPQDDEILQSAHRALEYLNRKYPCEVGSTFYLLVRKRLWNPKEGVWMGWERKRGKLTEFNALLLGDKTTSFTDIFGDTEVFSKIRYVITLDSDTELPRDAAKRLIGTMAHPLNIPLLNKEQTRVIRGYGLLQPRILVKHESLFRSRLAYWFAGVTGIDPYTFAISDPYQDLFGHGIFTGKGIYDLTVFDKILSHRFPDNTVLSHDLLEGGFLRAGLVTDIELMDDFPSNYYSYLQRMHRWVRGDWQLLRWFSPLVRNRRGTRLWVDLPIITRWQMLDNLRRSLLDPALLFLTILSVLGLPGWKMGWMGIVVSTIAIPFFIHSLNSFKQRLKWRWRWRNLLSILGQIVVTIVMLPFKSAVLLDAILRTLYRLLISKKHLLEWVTAADVERQIPKKVNVFIFRLSKGYVFVLFLLIGTFVSEPDMVILSLGIVGCWIFGPLLAYWLSKPQLDKKPEMNGDERSYVRALAYDTWRFFEQIVRDEDNWLPPDNLQVDPPRGIAHRTSPTNIGLLLGSTLVARDLGYLTTTELITRLEHTLDSLETMQRWQGHFYNWYDTCTLEPLLPLYVSTVDSGNMVAYLLTAKQGVKEWGKNPLITHATLQGMLDRIIKEEQDVNQQSVELKAWKQQLEDAVREQKISYLGWYQLLLEAKIEKFPPLIHQRVNLALEELRELIPSLELIEQMNKQDFSEVASGRDFSAQERMGRLGSLWEKAQSIPEIIDVSRESLKICEEMSGGLTLQLKEAFGKGLLNLTKWLAKIETLQTRLETMATEPDFRPLYNEKIRFMAIGYNVSSQQRDNSYYDLMASEARQASFIGIALRQLPTEHWFALGRTLTMVGRDTALLSWTGTMFEYLMPLLLMNCYKDTLWEETYHSIVKKHISYATKLGLPWGISESGFYAFDFEMNYQYQAFGVPFLGLKRGLGYERVIAPYATVLASLIDFKAAVHNLMVLEKWGARGEYGFYEALDFTKERLPEAEQSVTIKSFMAHHQGMSLVALSHLLLDRPLNRRFHADPRIQAIELLLQERISQKPLVLNRWKWTAPRPPSALDEHEIERHFYSSDTPLPEARILSNGRYVVMLTSSGSGFSRFGEIAVTRWRENPAKDPWGSFFYINDLTDHKIWSATYQPCHDRSASEEISFSLEKVTYTRKNGDIHTFTEISVSPEWDAEIRRITFTNQGSIAHVLEVTSYSEVVLAPQAADDAHPAFNKLFVHTEFSNQPEALLAQRRGRTPEEHFPWAAHSVNVEGKTVGILEYETDRARFLGRGQFYDRPKAVVENQRLSGTLGSVLDPIFALRKRVEVPPGKKVRLTFVTGVAETRGAVLTMIQHLSSPHQVEHTLDLAWTRSRIEMRYLNLSTRQADLYQWMLSQIFYFNPLRAMRAESITQNRKGQSALWKYGISGDIPLVLLHISEVENLDFVSSVLLAHEYWRLRGLKVDLLILNDFVGSYEQPLTEALRHLVFASSDRDFMDRPGGVFIRSSNIMPLEDKILFSTVARISLKADGGNLAKQLTAPKVEENLPAVFVSQVSSWTPERVSAPSYDREMTFFNGLGGFVAGGREYAIYLNENKLTPVPWSNILANPSFGTQISESGAGYTWAENSRENKLTPWNNDPIMDLPGEVCYLRDEHSGEYWSLTCFPIYEEDPYTVKHGWGYSRFEHTSHGIFQQGLVFVPLKESLKVWQVTLKNLGQEAREISLTYYVEWVLGVQREVNAPYIITEFDERSGALLARNSYQEIFPDRQAFLWVQTVGEVPSRTWTGDRMEFIGRHGSLKKPAALSRVALSNSSGLMYNACGAIQVTLALEPGEEKQVLVLLGQARSSKEVTSLTSSYAEPLRVAEKFQEVRDFWVDIVRGVQVFTPDKSMNLMLNGWLLYQTLSCRMWARSAFYQAGGAYGFRDQLQDSLALLHVCPELTKEQILRHAEHQFQEGDVQHWWHEETKRGIRTKFSDDLLWLPYSVLRYLEHTQDYGLLVQEVCFLEDLPLGPTEDERYSETKISTERASLFEHCLRAIERSLRFGSHGLPLMGTGDWNDGMNRVGREGKGESVWLGWFLYTILIGFAELCERREAGDIALRYRQVAEELANNLNEEAWDGQWYRRAYFDNGQTLGSAENQECQIDAIAQAWSVISGAAPSEKAKLAMLAVDRELVYREYSLIRLLTPPFDKTEPSPGYIQGYPPGVRENGGQYTHGVIWSIIAWAKLGDGDKAWELFQMINPINHALTPSEVLRYKVEPYVIAADVYSAEPNIGRGGWTWYTGAAGWMYQAGVEWILGLQRRGNDLYLKPCIPKAWGEYTMTYRFNQTIYQIQVQNPLHKSTGGTMLELDKVEIEFKEPYISLKDDGFEHFVRLIL
ncbi:MAG: glycosyl transferase family 36 [Desulfitobacterium hafniense]|nr:glycosyl transferase family 36 [Desulfitobacterium hafniense]